MHEKIKLVPVDVKNRPDWHKEKVYPANKVPALEHNNAVKGESLGLIKYINDNFQGPSLYPDASSMFDLQNVVISVPLPALTEAPNVRQIDEYNGCLIYMCVVGRWSLLFLRLVPQPFSPSLCAFLQPVLSAT
ncbi:hypothetical protein LXL04_000243 [Taraxacum kok-saghyz]